MTFKQLDQVDFGGGSVAALSASLPEAREFWMSWIKECLEEDADGIELRGESDTHFDHEAKSLVDMTDLIFMNRRLFSKPNPTGVVMKESKLKAIFQNHFNPQPLPVNSL